MPARNPTADSHRVSQSIGIKVPGDLQIRTIDQSLVNLAVADEKWPQPGNRTSTTEVLNPNLAGMLQQ